MKQDWKIQIIKEVPVDGCHGITVGRIFNVIRKDESDEPFHYRRGLWIRGDAGEDILVYDHEYENIYLLFIFVRNHLKDRLIFFYLDISILFKYN